MQLTEKFQQLKRETNTITNNPLLNCFEQDALNSLDVAAENDAFLAEKKAKILKLVKKIKIDFDPQLKSAYDEFSEAIAYMCLSKHFNVTRIPEAKTKTPDFKIEFVSERYGTEQEITLYAELKSLAYADGNRNYQKTMEQSVGANIDIEEQLRSGKNIAFGYYEIQPFAKDNIKSYSTRYIINTFIDKIDQNVKSEQYAYGETVLMIDLKQTGIPSDYRNESVPVYQERMFGSNVSGVLWNAAFGQIGYQVFKPIEFEGKENIDGTLEKDGILIRYDFIKAIVFFVYSLSSDLPKIVGLHRYRDTSDEVAFFLNKFCHFVNDDMNTEGWRLTEPEL